MSAVIASAAIAAVGAGYKIYQGISQNSAANKLQKGLVRPMYKIQDQYYQNQSLAQNQAQHGLDESSRDYYSDQTGRGFASGASAILQGGGDVNSIGSLYDKFNQSNRAIAVEDARLKNDNIRYLIERNKDLAGQENTQWAINQYEPYKDTASAIAGLRGSSSQNISSGIGELGSTVSTLGTNMKKEGSSTSGPDADKVIDTNGLNPSGDLNNGSIVSPSQTFGSPNPFGSATVPGSDKTANYMLPLTGSQIPALATNNTLKSYQNSPYYEQLSAYLNQAVA